MLRTLLNRVRRNPAVAPSPVPAVPTPPIPLSPFDKDPRDYTTSKFIRILVDDLRDLQSSEIFMTEKMDGIGFKIHKVLKQSQKPIPNLAKKRSFLCHQLASFGNELYSQNVNLKELLDRQIVWERHIRSRSTETENIPDSLDIKIRTYITTNELGKLRETDWMLTKLIRLLESDTNFLLDLQREQGQNVERHPPRMRETSSREKTPDEKIKPKNTIKGRIIRFFNNMVNMITHS
ncbi:hypothetical protein ScPMuIL_008326 [Solemya velum]